MPLEPGEVDDSTVTAPSFESRIGHCRLVPIAPGRARDELLPLFLLADDSEQQVRSYYQHGRLFAVSGRDGVVRGITLVLDGDDDVVELKTVAIASGLRRRGLGRHMLALVLRELQLAGTRRVLVGTGNCSLGEIAFYQKAGFRLYAIQRDVFTPARGYPRAQRENGIALRDLVWLDTEL
jgi:ribosomal protein S18 acetylase RimI-like enzyme